MGPQGDPLERARLLDAGRALVERVYGFRKPLVMAATGHGLALGAILLLAGDVRVAASETKAKFGLNEVYPRRMTTFPLTAESECGPGRLTRSSAFNL